MKVISIINLKGGVGKTVTAINMAAILSGDYKKRVLLIDADSQHNTTDFYGVDTAGSTLSDVLTGRADYYPEFVVPADAGIDILPADDSLMQLDIGCIKSQTVRGTVLRDLISALVEDDAYDFVLIDCPPAFNAASTAALAASNEAIIPIKLDAFSLAGLNNVIAQIANMHAINPGLRVAGCLITMWTKAAAEAEAKLRKLPARSLPVFAQVIRRSDKVDGMTFAGNPLMVYSPRSAAGVDYRRFVAEYLEEDGVKNG